MPRAADTDFSFSSGDLAEEFLRNTRKELRTRRERIETCARKLTQEQIWTRRHENENAIGNLILHLCGNVRQWIICGVGGVVDQRDRGAEFARREPLAAEELLSRLRETMEEADRVLEKVRPEDLLSKRKIQVYEVTVLHAIYHVAVHFSEHTGQIIWATKGLTGEDLAFYGYLSGKQRKPQVEKQEP
jgi:uncharacterized damage-inducible protein DinB